MSVVPVVRSALERRLHLLAIVAISAVILHILATLAAPIMAASTPYTRLGTLAPLHAFAVLPPVTPQTQPLPFLSADARYAICRFDTQGGPVDLDVQLAGRGWSLGIHTPQGDNIYTTVGQDAQTTRLALRLAPVSDRFLGLSPEARGVPSAAQAPLSIPAGRGLAILRAPDRGFAYVRETEAVLRAATCVQRPF
jgi:uncharacterized membrane protein